MSKKSNVKKSKEIAKAKKLILYWKDVDQRRTERVLAAKAEYENAKARYLETRNKYDQTQLASDVAEVVPKNRTGV